MRILITGANGLLGQKLIALLQQQTDVYAIATARTPLIQPIHKGEFCKLDITNEAEVESVISQTKPDVIIHTAAMTQVDQCETDQEACTLNNVTAVQYLVTSCSKKNVRLIHLSTDFIFDGSHGPLDENALPNPVNFYGSTKLKAEQIIQNSSIDWCILRTVLVYGITPDMSRSNIVLWVKKSLEEGKRINVVNDQWRTPTLAEDLAMGCYLAATKNATGIYNISGKDFITPYEMAIQTANYFKLDATLIHETNSSNFKQPAQRPLITGFNISKAIQELDYKPHSFTEGLEILAKQLAH